MRFCGYMVACPFILAAQDGWMHTYGAESWEWATDLEYYDEAGYLIAGWSDSFNADHWADGWLIRTDAGGDTLWTHLYRGFLVDELRDVEPYPEGGLLLLGWTTSFGNGSGDLWLIRTAENGDTLWTRTYGGEYDEQGHDLAVLPDGSWIVIGETSSWGSGSSDIWLLRGDDQGSLLWDRQLGAQGRDVGYAFIRMNDSLFIAAGVLGTDANEHDMRVFSFDMDGEIHWIRDYACPNDEYPRALVKAENGDVIVVGSTYPDSLQQTDALLIRMTATGDTLWSRHYGGMGTDYVTDIILADDGGFLVSGCTNSFGSGWYDAWLLRIDAVGDTLWTHTYGGSSGDYADAVRAVPDGGYVFTGRTHSYGAGFSDIWLVKVDPDGELLSNYHASQGLAPQSFRILQVFPNPFNLTVTINYELLEPAPVAIRVFDLSGRQIWAGKPGIQPAGRNRLHWEGVDEAGQELPSGVYVIQLSTPGWRESRKVVVSR